MRARSIALASIIALLVLGCNAPATIPPVPKESVVSTVEPSRTPEPIATQMVSTSTELPTQTLTPEPSLQTDGPYFMYFRQVDWAYQLVMLDADGEGRKIISLPPEIAEILPIQRFDPDMKFVSPDGKWLAFYSGSAGNHGKMPVTGTADLTLNVLDLTTGEKQVVTSLLSKNYPDNFAEAVSQLTDPYNTSESLFEAFVYGITNSIAWSPDGKYLAFAGQMDGLSSDLYVYDVSKKTILRLTDGPEELQWIEWSPDGKWIVHGSLYHVGAGMTFNIYAASLSSPARYLSTAPLFGGIEYWLDSHSYLEYDASNGPGTYGLRLVDLNSGRVTRIWDGAFTGIQFDRDKKWLLLFAFSSVEPGSLQNEDPNFSPGLKLINLDTFKIIPAPDPFPDPPDTFLRTESGEIISLNMQPFEMGDKKISLSPDSKYWAVVMDQKVKVYAADITLIKEIPVPDYSGALRNIEWMPDSSGLFLLYETDLYSIILPEGNIRLVEPDLVDSDPYHRIFMWTTGN